MVGNVLPLAPTRRPLLERIGPLEGWTVTLYEKCDLRCTYCITGVQGTSIPRSPREEVAAQIRRELATIPPSARITVGALCDAYPRAEAEHGVARAAIAELIEQRRLNHIVTKGATILRDVDLLRTYPPARVIVSLCSHDDDLLRKVDPKAPTVRERLDMVRALDDAGVTVEVAAAPWIPEITDAQALIGLVPEHITVRFTALRVADTHVVDTPFGRRFDQQEVNDAYSEARSSVPEQPNVYWARPPSTDGAPPHVRVLLGKREAAADLTPAPPRTVAVFFHVRETGGAAVERMLAPHYPTSSRYPSPGVDRARSDAYVDVKRLLALSAERRSEVRLYCGHFPFVVADLLGLDENAIRFTLLRDPVERTVAFLHHCRRHHPAHRYRSLEELYDDPLLHPQFVHEHQTRTFALSAPEVPSVDLRSAAQAAPPAVTPLDDATMHAALANLEQLDVVGVAERFEHFVQQVGERLRIHVQPVDPGYLPTVQTGASKALRARILADNPCDVALHRRACELAER